jgi:Trk-type K+ transport system membrane component
MEAFTSIKEFKRELANNPQLQQEFKSDPVQAAEKIKERPLDTDVWIYRIVVFALGATILSIIIGIIVLIGSDQINDDHGVPTILTAIGSAAIGALAGLLAPSPTNPKN